MQYQKPQNRVSIGQSKTILYHQFELLWSPSYEKLLVLSCLPLKLAPAMPFSFRDGFIGAFYQRAWPIIKHDIMVAMLKLYVCAGRGFAKLNRALVLDLQFGYQVLSLILDIKFLDGD